MEMGRQRRERSTQGLVMAAFAVLSLPLAVTKPAAPTAISLPNSKTNNDVKAAAVQPASVQTSPAGAQSAASPQVEAAVAHKIVVSIPERRLAIVERGRVKKLYRVAVGAQESPSPTGTFRIVNKVARPGYWHKGTVVAPGSGNPVGSRWIGLDRAHYGIHGTNEPDSIGQAASHGCVRMERRDLEELFAQVRVGDEVEIADAPIAAATDVDEQEASSGQ